MYNDILNSFIDPILVINKEKDIKYVNASFEETFCVNSNLILNKNLNYIIDEDSPLILLINKAIKNLINLKEDKLVISLRNQSKKQLKVSIFHTFVEKNLIVETLAFLKSINSEDNYILISDYQIYNAILNKRDYSPVKYWFKDATYPSKNKTLRSDFEKFFRNKIINNNISIIVVDNTANFKTNEINEFAWLNNCLKKIKINNDSNFDAFRIKKNCV